MNSTHKCEVFRIEDIGVHPNADALEVVQFYGYTCCVRKGDFHAGDTAVYIPPDSLVQTSFTVFSFLAKDAYTGVHRYAGFARIRARKLRGVVSQGLVMLAADYMKIGDDVAEELGVRHYEPEEPRSGGGRIPSGPPVEGPLVPIYDVESWHRYGYLFLPGETVIVTEKIHGTNIRVVWDGTKLHVGSRRQWKADAPGCVYHQALKRDPCIETVARENPGRVFYGEVFGDIQDLKYGHGKGERSVVFFDQFQDGHFITLAERELLSLPTVPTLYIGPYDPDTIAELINGPTRCGGEHLREGIVIETVIPRWSLECGRMKLKAVSPLYLERAK
jgi:RNA ligase (TIGR02306 family)